MNTHVLAAVVSEEPRRNSAHIGSSTSIVGRDGRQATDVLLVGINRTNVGEQDLSNLLQVIGTCVRQAFALRRKLLVCSICR